MQGYLSILYISNILTRDVSDREKLLCRSLSATVCHYALSLFPKSFKKLLFFMKQIWDFSLKYSPYFQFYT